MSPFPLWPGRHRLAQPMARRGYARQSARNALLGLLLCLGTSGVSVADEAPPPECIKERLQLLARVMENGVGCYRSAVEKTTFDVPACLTRQRVELLEAEGTGWDDLVEDGKSTCGTSEDATEIWNRAVPVIVQLSEDVQRSSTGNNQLSLQGALDLRSGNLKALKRHIKKVVRFQAKFAEGRKQKKLDRALDRAELQIGLAFVSAVRAALELNVDYLGIGINGIRLSMDAFAHDELYPALGVEPPVERAHQVFFTIDPVAFEYSHALERLLVLDAADRRLLRYDPIRTASDVIIFQDPTLHLGLGPDGIAAVVGHPNSISIVDLGAASSVDAIVKILALDVPISDIVFIEERKAILLPGSPYDLRLRLLDLDEETISVIPGLEMEPFARGRLHPRGDAVYAAGPHHVSRLTIADGTITAIEFSPDHRGNALPANLFFSDDGATVFPSGVPALRSDADPDLDLIYGGRLEGTSSVEALVHRPSSEQYLASPGGPGDRGVKLYDDAFLNEIGTWKLPRLKVEKLRFQLHVRHLFLRSDAKRYIVVFEVDFKADAATAFGVIVRGFNPADFEAAKQEDPIEEEEALAALEQPIVDAAWSRPLGRIVFGAVQPNALLLFDPATDESTSVPLPLPPIAVALSADGTEAAVGHDGWVSRVDLVAGIVLDTLPLATRTRDLVLAPGDAVHVFPDFLPWDRVRSLDLVSGDEGEGNGSPGDVRSYGALHPEGDFLYAADASAIKKFDLRSGIAERIATSVGRSDVRGCGRLWINPAGDRLLNGCGQWIRASEAPQADLRLLGTLAGTGRVLAHDEIESPPRVALLRSEGPDADDATVIEIYDGETLQIRQTFGLPRFLNLDRKADGLGRFVFLSNDGAAVHIVLEADPTVTKRTAFGVATIELAVD